MWPGMVVSLIDRPWSRVLRAGRGRASLALEPRERAGQPPARLCALMAVRMPSGIHRTGTEGRERGRF